ncbi:hypothetical protein [Methanimicrococcus hongohii]|nr:hypothetical protein [Methanimicrococcus sp. Hf6]
MLCRHRQGTVPATVFCCCDSCKACKSATVFCCFRSCKACKSATVF